jgi:hopene-associated glycosyltransferase HpnB
MPYGFDAVASLAAAIWLYLSFFRGGFWRIPPGKAPPCNSIDAVAVIPARNESGLIGKSVSSLAVQSIHVIVSDDESNDGTAREACLASRDVTVCSAGVRPCGWTGKMWAVHIGLEQAKKLSPRFVLLTDADIEHSNTTVRQLVAIAEQGNYDLVSWMVHLHCTQWHEKILIPAFVYFFFKLYPPNWVRDPRKSAAAAAGGCMLVRSDALDRIGGASAIRGELIDDCALASRIKASGGRVWLGITKEARSIRPYNGPGEIWRMIKRTAFTQLRHSPWLLAGTAVGMLATYVSPVLLALTGNWLAVGACVMMIMTYAPMVRWYGLPVWWTLTLPFTAVFYLSATFASAVDFWQGRGGQWKGRIQDLRSG